MSFSDIGIYSGLASLLVHLVQGGFHLAKHLRIRSNCCGTTSEFELDTSSPVLSEPKEGILEPVLDKKGG